MREIFPNLYEVLPSKPTPKKYRSFFVQREAGNLLIPCYANSSTIDAHFDTIAQLGGVSHQLLTDSHFKSAHCDEVAARFQAPLYCSEQEAPDVTPGLKQVVTFPFTQHTLTEGVEVIPTPGHRVGGVCYRVTVGDQSYLFAGDFIWHDGTQWIPTPTKAGVKAYTASLRLLETLEFDVLLANSQISNTTYAVDFSAVSRPDFFAALVKQLNPV
jgi:hydroxyacylglutathione hydrolase